MLIVFVNFTKIKRVARTFQSINSQVTILQLVYFDLTSKSKKYNKEIKGSVLKWIASILGKFVKTALEARENLI